MTNQTPNNQPGRLPRPRRREFPAPLTQPLSDELRPERTAVATTPEPDYDEFDDYDDYEPQHESLLRNPYVLAAMAVAGAIVLAIVVVVMAGGGGGGGGNAVVNTPNPLGTQVSGVTVESISTATVREGPGTDYGSVGSLPRGQKVTVTGRNDDAKWFQIVFPQNSGLRGWVPSSALKVGDLNTAAIAVVSPTPLSRPTQVPPTSAPRPTQAATEVVTATATAEPGPDIAVTMNCTAGAPVAVTIRNAGDTAITARAATVTISIGGQVKSTGAIQLTLDPASAVAFPSTEVITAPSTSVQVVFTGAPADSDPSDNTAQCTVNNAATSSPTAGTQASSTPTSATSTPTAGP